MGQFFMGVDIGGYDGSTFSFCVLSEDGRVFTYQGTDREEFEKEMERVVKCYEIPETHIYREY